MKEIKRVCCVCIGNSDRSPAMEAVLKQYLKAAGHDVEVESAGAGPSAKKEGGAAAFAVRACSLIGLDISKHKKRSTANIDMTKYDLIVVVDDSVAAMLMEQGVPMDKIYNASVPPGQWPYKFQEDYDQSFERIPAAMYRVVIRYFANPAS